MEKIARNLDLKVVKTYPKEFTAEDIAQESISMSLNIGLNDGRSANEIVWEDFHDAVEMTNYEYAAYDILGDEECDRQGIETLHDLFGDEFANRFFKRKNQLIAQSDLVTMYKERAELQARIDKAEVVARGDRAS